MSLILDGVILMDVKTRDVVVVLDGEKLDIGLFARIIVEWHEKVKSNLR